MPHHDGEFQRAVLGDRLQYHEAQTMGAFVHAVASFAAFVPYRGLHSRAVASVVPLRFERALAMGALVFRTREAHSAPLMA